MSRSFQTVNFIAVVLPFAALVVAIWLLWGVAFSWTYLGLLVGMYLVTGFGVTLGYHRLFTHKSFDAPAPVRWLLGVFGSMSGEGRLIDWVAYHRAHHQHSDEIDDPHSPHAGHPDGVWGSLKGFAHAHMGWFLSQKPPDVARYAPDLLRDPVAVHVSRHFGLWVLLGLLVPAAIGGLATWSWWGVLLGFIWGGLVRAFFVHHVTWSVNSVCHIWGGRPYESHDQSRNNAIFGILALGEGWHNNHHAFPTSARHGLAWWQLDTSYVLLRAMQLVGLARNVRTPAPERLAARRKQ